MRCKILELLKTAEGKTVAKHNTWIWWQGGGSDFQSLWRVFKPKTLSVLKVSLKGNFEICILPFNFSLICLVVRSCVA